METQTEEQKIEAIKAMYEAIGKGVIDAYTEMEKTIAGIADVLRKAEQ